MLRWFRAAAATAVWTFLIAGLVGLVDTGVRLAVGGAPLWGGPPAILASVVLAGWLGTVVAVVALVPISLLWWRRTTGPAWSVALAVASGVGVMLAIVLGSLVHDTAAGLWWREHLGSLWIPRLALAGLTALGLAWLWRRPTAALLGGSTLRLLSPVMLLVGLTLLCPDGHESGRRHRLSNLEAGVAPAGAPNVVLLSIDALRRDKVHCLDAGAPPTPHLDALAAEGRLFTNAWSTSSWTLPAMGTLLTGLPPRALGVTREIGLSPAVATLAQSAWRAGWFTSAVVGNPFMSEAFGVPRGFAHYDHADVLESIAVASPSSVVQEATRYITAATNPLDGLNLAQAAMRWLEERPAEQPFFLWLHFMDPHLPYRAHPDAQGRWPELPSHPLLAPDHFMNLDALRAELDQVPADARQAIEALYDGEVTHADRAVGALLEALDALDALDNTWVVVVADHGEEFFEHGGFEHGHSLMPEVTGIPLIIRPPRGHVAAGTRDQRAVSLLDVVPSLCAELGWTVPNEAPGRASLMTDIGPATLTVLENMLYGPPRQATLRWPDFGVSAAGAGDEVWFDLALDPGAFTPMAAPDDSVVVGAATRVLLGRWEARARELGAGAEHRAVLDDAAKRRLESLGY